MSETRRRCRICGEDAPGRLQTHHIVPRRHGGSDAEVNLATLCAGCHQAVEKLYDKRFYRQLGVTDSDGPAPAIESLYEAVAEGRMKYLQKAREHTDEDTLQQLPKVAPAEMSDARREGFELGMLTLYTTLLERCEQMMPPERQLNTL